MVLTVGRMVSQVSQVYRQVPRMDRVGMVDSRRCVVVPSYISSSVKARLIIAVLLS
jgi:hypothetical protein